MRAHLRRGIMDKKDGPSEGEVLEKVQGWCRGEDGGDGKDDAVDEDDYARAAVCPHAPELVHACYPHCIQSATEEEGWQCFEKCVHHILENHGPDSSLLETKKLQNVMRDHLRRGILDKKHVPSEDEVLETVQRWCRGEDGGDDGLEDGAIDAFCEHRTMIVDTCYPPCVTGPH